MPGTIEAGQDITSFDPLFFWAPKGNPLPDTDREPYDLTAWTDRGFKQILDTVNGAAVTKRNPKTPVTGDRTGRVAMLPSGDDGVAIGLQLLFPEIDLLAIISSMNQAVQTAAGEVVTLTVTAGANAAGNVSVVLDGLSTPVAVLATDTTADQVAAKIRATAFAGWTTGGTGAVVTFTAAATGRKGAAAFSGGATGATGTIQKTVEGLNAKKTRYVSKNAQNSFMLGFEGVAEAGGLFDVDTHIMAIAFNAENTANAEWVWRETGADALIRPTLTLEALASPITDLMLAGSGVSRNVIDPSRKFIYVEKEVA